MNQRKLGVGLSYLNISIQLVVNFLYVPILLYYMGKNEYGLYQLMGALIAYFSVMDFGLSSAVIRAYSKFIALKDKIGMENTLAIAGRMYGVLSIIILFSGAILYFFLDDIFSTGLTNLEIINAKKIYILLLFNMIVTISTMIFRSVINAHEKYLFLKGLETVQIVIQPFAVIAIMSVNPTALAMVFVQTLCNIGVILGRIYYCFYKLKMIVHYHFFDKILFFDIKKLAISAFVVSIVDQIFWKTNQLILGIISGTELVAVYSIASMVYMSYMNLSTAISSVFLPKITKMVATGTNNKELTHFFIKIGRLQYFLLALVLSGFCIFGQEFISRWAGSDFSDAYFITLIIIIPFTVDLIQNIGSCILKAQNTYGFKAKVYICIGILNLILAIPLAYKYGSIGCAFASGISMFIGNGLVMNWYYLKITKLDIKDFWMQIIHITFFVILSSLGGDILNYVIHIDGMISLLIKVLIYTLLYVLIMWKFAMNTFEKSLINNLWGTYVKKM